MPTRLELREYEDYPVEIPLGAEQLQALKDAHIDVTPRGGDTYILRPSESRIGVLALGDLAIVVRPKIPIDRVMFMISYVLDIGDWRQDDAPLAEDADLLEAIIPAFTHHTRQAIRRGLLQGYRSEEDALHTVRGRIRFGDQIRRRFDIPLPIEISFDDFTEDIEENGCSRPRSTSWAACPFDPQGRGGPCAPCVRPSRRSSSARTGAEGGPGDRLQPPEPALPARRGTGSPDH